MADPGDLTAIFEHIDDAITDLYGTSADLAGGGWEFASRSAGRALDAVQTAVNLIDDLND